MTYTSWRVKHNWKRIIMNVLTMSNLVDDRMQSLRSRSKRKLQSIVQWTSLRSRSMRKLNKFLRKRRSEFLINFAFRRLELFLKRLISIRLKKNLWKQINVLIATNRIISIVIARNLENSKMSKWTWKMIQRNREKNNLRQKRYEDERLDHLIIFEEEWLIRWNIRVDELCVEEQNLHNNYDRHWCHWIRIY